MILVSNNFLDLEFVNGGHMLTSGCGSDLAEVSSVPMMSLAHRNLAHVWSHFLARKRGSWLCRA